LAATGVSWLRRFPAICRANAHIFHDVGAAHALQSLRRMRVAIAALAVCLSAPASASPGAIAIPPVAVDMGAGIAKGAESVPSTELRVGGSWASLYWKPTSFDIAIGYVGSYRSLAPTGEAARSTTIIENSLRLHGAYFEVAHAIENHRHWRTWLGARIETLTGDYRERSIHAVGGALRLGAELYSAGVGGGGGGNAAAVFAGVFGLGVYVEGTARSLPKELGPVGIGAGVSVRIPFLAAIGT
jgi:hypothetical protein